MSISLAEYFGYVRQMMFGTVITLELFLVSFFLSVILGTIVAVVSLSRNILVQAIWRVYASIMMGVPSLLIIFIIYYGGSALLSSLFGTSRGFDVSPLGAGVAALTLVNAVYVAELVRGAINNLPRGQFEACAVLTIPPVSAWFYVILPQIFRLALSGLANIWIIILKESSLVTLIGLNDLIAVAKTAGGATQEPFLFLVSASLFYIVVSWISLPMWGRIEMFLDRGIRRAEA